MQNDEIKARVLKVLAKTQEGKSVNVDITVDGVGKQLRVTGNSAKNAPAAGAATVVVELHPETVKLEFDEPGEEELVEKITAAAEAQGTAVAAGSVLPQVVLTRDDARKVWILFNACSYEPDTIICTITAPAGFETDLSSIPRALWSIIEPAELSLAAPVFHDLIYRSGGGKLPAGHIAPPHSHVFSRSEVVNLFLELMAKAGLPRWKRMAGYWAIRAFAGFAWRS
jgi:hypothetical protein